MTNYQLAKLVQLAGGLPGRKRVQKTVHLLQAAGCDFDLEFRLHYYGPYSQELAEKLDRMRSRGILKESTEQAEWGTQYNYDFNDEMRDSIGSYESTARGQAAKTEMQRFQPLLNELGRVQPRVLELASTIVAFRQSGRDREVAVQETAEFKGENVNSWLMEQARELAETVLDWNHGEF